LNRSFLIAWEENEMRLFLAMQAFFAVLIDSKAAEAFRRYQSGTSSPDSRLPDAGETAAAPVSKKTLPAGRSDALTFLSLLQREGRIVDFLMEPVGDYDDAQIGAAARSLHADCGAVLRKVFGPQPIRAENDGAAVELPSGFDAARYKLLGSISGTPPYRGCLLHPGWIADRCDLPEWSGSASSALVIAPAEVEIRA
jgi:hypothetical protein